METKAKVPWRWVNRERVCVRVNANCYAGRPE